MTTTKTNLLLLKPSCNNDEVAILIGHDLITVIPPQTTGCVAAIRVAGNYKDYLGSRVSVSGPLSDARHVLNVATRLFRLQGIIAKTLSPAA